MSKLQFLNGYGTEGVVLVQVFIFMNDSFCL